MLKRSDRCMVQRLPQKSAVGCSIYDLGWIKLVRFIHVKK